MIFQYQAYAGPHEISAVAAGDAIVPTIVLPDPLFFRRKGSDTAIYIVAANVMPPDPLPGLTGVRPPYKISHEVFDVDARTRKALQQMSSVFNGLLLSGELRGTVIDPKLGYQPASIPDWGTTTPYTVKAALDAIAARLKAIEDSL